MEQLYLRENYQNSCSLNPFMQLKLITGFYEFGWNLIKSDLCTIMIKIYMRTGGNHQITKSATKITRDFLLFSIYKKKSLKKFGKNKQSIKQLRFFKIL